MLKGALIATAFALAAVAITQGPAATADAPKCKNKANKYVACTDKLKANAPRRKRGNVDAGDYVIWRKTH